MWKDWKSGAFHKMSSALHQLPTNPCMLQSSRAGGIKEQQDRDLLTEEKETKEECDHDAWVKFPQIILLAVRMAVDIGQPKYNLNSEEQRQPVEEVEPPRVAWWAHLLESNSFCKAGKLHCEEWTGGINAGAPSFLPN